VAEHVSSWAVGALGASVSAEPAVRDRVPLVLGTREPAFARQVADALKAAGFKVTHRSDPAGLEVPASPQEATTLAGAA
jgi:glycerol-3-phosphate dehydrogenase (NAD(P)+)